MKKQEVVTPEEISRITGAFIGATQALANAEDAFTQAAFRLKSSRDSYSAANTAYQKMLERIKR